MKRSLFARLWRHPVLTCTRILVFGFATSLPASEFFVAARISATGDPVQIADWNVDRVLRPHVAADQIDAALGQSDIDLAESFVALAREHNVYVPRALLNEVQQQRANRDTVIGSATEFSRSFLDGKPNSPGGFAGVLAADYVGYGDARDFTSEAYHCLVGEPYNPVVLALSGTGLALTVVSFGLASAPVRPELSLLKFAEREGRLNTKLVWRLGAVLRNPGKLGALSDFAGDIANVYESGGIASALDTLSLIESPEEAAIVARLSLVKGKEVRAMLRLLGRKAIEGDVNPFDLLKWAVSAILGFLGFCVTCKATAERMTERYLVRTKLRQTAGHLTKPA